MIEAPVQLDEAWERGELAKLCTPQEWFEMRELDARMLPTEWWNVTMEELPRYFVHHGERLSKKKDVIEFFRDKVHVSRQRLADAVHYATLGRWGSSGEPVIDDILMRGQVVMLCGEEGAGKSTLAHEIACGLPSGRVLGEFPAQAVERVLIVDVEQTEQDAQIIRDDLERRGLSLSGVYWVDGIGRSFDNEDDKRWLREQVRAVNPHVLVIDTATEAVSKPREDESVKQLFVLLGNLMRNDGVLGAILLAQPRKRSQEATGARQFDDMFGSRVWKGRSSAAFWIEGETLTVWKQRGSHLLKRWGGKQDEKYARGRIARVEDGPTLLLGPMGQEERRGRILEAVGANPGAYSKTSLIERHFHITERVERDRWRDEVDTLVDTGQMVQEGRHNSLSLTPAR